MIRPKGLGRGLDALLSGGNEDAPRDALHSLAIGRIKPGKYQPRTRMDDSFCGLSPSLTPTKVRAGLPPPPPR